jgi:hypothetical protein
VRRPTRAWSTLLPATMMDSAASSLLVAAADRPRQGGAVCVQRSERAMRSVRCNILIRVPARL